MTKAEADAMTKAEAKELERAIKRDLNTQEDIREALGPRVDIWVEQQRQTARVTKAPTFYVVIRRQNALAGITTYIEWREYLASTTGIPLPVVTDETMGDVQSL